MATTSASKRPYAAAHFALELDGKDTVGLFRSVEGGGVKADVMTYQPGANEQTGYSKWKQLGKPKFDDIKVQVGMAMSEPFFLWLSDFFSGVATRKTGSIVAADFHYIERARRNFKEAMIKELVFPKLDAADKNAAYMTIGIAVEEIEYKKGSGEKLKVENKWADQKLWTACNFRFQIDDYKDSCTRVTKVDSFTVKQNTAEYHMGGRKTAVKTPTAVEFPNLTFYVPEVDAQPFIDHVAKRVGFGGKGKGEVRPAEKMHGHIQTYDHDDRTLFTLEFFGADITSVTPDRSDASSEEIKQVKVELYTERMEFSYPNAQ